MCLILEVQRQAKNENWLLCPYKGLEGNDQGWVLKLFEGPSANMMKSWGWAHTIEENGENYTFFRPVFAAILSTFAWVFYL